MPTLSRQPDYSHRHQFSLEGTVRLVAGPGVLRDAYYNNLAHLPHLELRATQCLLILW